MTFDKAAFEATLDEIEKLLGYVRGNENVWDVYQQMITIQRGIMGTDGYAGFETIYVDREYPAVPCPDKGYALQPSGLWQIDLPIPVGSTDFASYKSEYIAHMKTQFDWAYEEGQAWASGIAGYCRSVCDRITSPVVGEYADAIREIGTHVIQVLTTGPDSDTRAFGGDWGKVGVIVRDWQSDAGNNAEEFYNEFSDVVMILANFTGWMNYGFCSVATLIQGTQQSLADFVRELKKVLVDQLHEWRDLHRPPFSEPTPPPEWVGDITKLGGDVLAIVEGKVPVVGNIVEKVDSAITDFEQYKAVGEDLMALFNISVQPKQDKKVFLATADQIYTTLTDVLYTDHYQAFMDALDNMQSGTVPEGLPTPDAAKDGGGTFGGKSIWDEWSSDSWAGFQAVSSDQSLS